MTTPAHRATVVIGALQVVAAGLLIAGCSTSQPEPATQPATQPPSTSSPSESGAPTTKAGGDSQAATLTISDFAFSTLTVTPGQEITVVNDDTAEHTVNVNGTDTDITVAGGGEATFKAPAEAGDYDLTCDFHSSMHGTLTVTR